MPLFTANSPSGESIRYFVPEGTSREEALRYAPTAYQLKRRGVDVEKPSEPVAPERTFGGYAKETGKGLLAGAAGLLEAAATGATPILRDELEPGAREAIAEVGGGIQDLLAPGRAYEDSTYLDVVRGAGSTLPFLATGFLGAPGLAAGIATGAAAGSGEAIQRAEAAGATERQIKRAGTAGLLPGLGETLVPFAIGKTIRAARAAKGLKDAIGEAPATDVLARLRRVGGAAGGEGLQEASAQVAQNLIAQNIYDPESGTFIGTGESLGIGAGVGGLIAALAELAIRDRGPRTSTPTDLTEEELAALPQAPVTSESLPDEELTDEQVQARLAEAAADEEALSGVVGEIQDREIRRDEGIFEEQLLFPELEPAQQAEGLVALGVRPTAPIIKRIEGKQLSDPIQRREVFDELQKYARNKNVKPATRRRIGDLLQDEVFADTRLDVAAGPGPAPQQMTIEEGIERDVRREEAEERRAQEFALAEAARRPDVPTAMGAALQAAETTGRRVPGQAQLEIPTIEPADPQAQQAMESADLDQQIAAEQRAIEATEAQAQEQVEMLGPRGGILRPTRPARRAAPAAPEPVAEPVAETTTPEPVAPAPEPVAEPVAETTTPAAKPVFTPSPETNAPRSRETATVISPDEFLNLAEDLPESQAREESEEFIREQIAKGEPLETPFLTFELDNKGIAKVTGHEGRHRARVLKEMGIAEMPVRLRSQGKNEIRWSEQDSATNRDRLDVPWPTTLEPQEGSSGSAVPFPIADPLAAEPAVEPAPAPEAASVVEEEAVSTAETEAAAVAAEQGDTDAEVLKAETEAVSQPTPEAEVKRSASREEDSTRVFEEVVSNPQGPVSKYFKDAKSLEEGIDALAADMSTGLTKENVAAQEWVKANLSATSRKDLSDSVRVMRESMGLPLPAAAIAVASNPLSQQIRAKLDAGDLRGAINDLTQSTDQTVARVATAIEQGLDNTKVVMVSGLTNAEGKTVAGQYDPATDTITLNQDADLKNHVLLHEAMHAVTSHEIAKNTPAAQQMRNLFDSVKDRLDTAYGATNLDEFVAEAFSNPEFQAKLGRITPKGEKISLWSRFKNIVENIVRRFRGQPSKKIESAMDKADSLVAELISPAPESRDATKLYSATVEGEEKATLNASGRFAKGKISKEDIAVAATAFSTAGGQAQNALMQFLPLNAVYKLAQKNYPRLAEKAEELFKLLQTKNGDRQKYLNRTKDTADAVERIIGKDKKVKEVLNNWTAESTLARVDPTKPESKYRGDEEALDAWNMMNDMLKGMTPAQQKAVKDSYSMLRDSYSEVYKILVKTMEKRIDDIKDADVRENIRNKLLVQRLEKEAIEPYFPLYRKGSHWVFYRARDPRTGQNETYKEAFQSEYAQQEAARQLRSTEGVDNIEVYTRNKTGNFGQVDAQFAFNLLADVRAKGADQSIQDVLLDSLFDIMPERSLVRAFKPRQGTRGFETDALKVFRERMPNFTNQIVNLKHDFKLSTISNELTDRKNEYKATPEIYSGAEKLEAQLQGYINFARNPKIATWSKALKTAGFGMTLGFNVSSVIVNASNLPIVVLPYLGGRYGFTDTMKAMNDARKLFMSTGTKRRTETFTGEGTREVFEGPSLSNIDFSASNLSNLPPEQRELKELNDLMEARGQSNISTTSENLDMENPANTAWTATNAYMGWMFHQGERFNRQVTAITSYKLELRERAKKGEITKQDREEAAEIALDDTELTNSGAMAETAPRVAQSNMGNWMMMYKRFGISMYYLQFQMARQAIDRAKTPDERKQAIQQIVGLFASSALFAGVQGLPLYGVVSMLANAILLGDEDEDFDSIAASYFGEGLYSGAINAVFDVDVAPRIGMTNLVYRSLPNREQESLILQAMEFLGGPVVGIASRMEDGIGLISEGEVSRGVERMLPSALSNGMKALRYGTEGATTLRGDPIMEDMNPWNVFAQSLGLAPAGYTKQLEVNARDKGVERRVNAKRTDMMRDYYMAIKEGDADTANELIQEMVEFSQRNPFAAISGQTLSRSMRQHRVTDEIARQLGGITASQRSMLRIIQRRMEDMGEE